MTDALPPALAYWRTLVADDAAMPWFEAAVAVAQDAHPQLDVLAVLANVDVLADRLKRRLADDAPPLHRLRLLNHYFFGELRFQGNVNDYDDPANSYLNEVLERRLGIPISLAMVYIEVGERIGLPLAGVAFPGHFLVRVSLADGAVIIDPFDQGRSLSREALSERLAPYVEPHGLSVAETLPHFLQAASPREMLARLLRNLKILHAQTNDAELGLAVAHRLVLLLPEVAEERRDRGLLYASLDCPRAALDDLQAYRSAAPDAADAGAIDAQMAVIRQAVGRLN